MCKNKNNRMVRRVLKFLLILGFSVPSFAQELKIEYHSIVTNILSEEAKERFSKDEIGQMQLKANENPPKEIYTLLIKGKKSSFTYVDRINNQQDQKTFDIRYTPAGLGTTYHDLENKLQKKDIGEIYGKNYVALDSLTDWNWKITQEHKEILGVEVIKAITKNEESDEITAWFSPEFNFSHEPAEYWGLPGLILEVERKKTNGTILYTAISIDKSKKKKFKLKENQKGIEIRESQINDLYEQGRLQRMKLES